MPVSPKVGMLSEISMLAQELAEIIQSGKTHRAFHFELEARPNGDLINGTRLKRLKRPLWLGEDGVVYYGVNHFGNAVYDCHRAELEKRDLEGLRRVRRALRQEVRFLKRCMAA